ncbi:MAG: hypothetical protein IKY93_06915 [Alistipes sp.]|nr:hypothetical protein [Alistipes sp.]
MKKENVRLIGYDSSLEFEKTLKAEDFCEIANKQVIPLFEALELELTEKDIKAAVTSRQTAKELYLAVINKATKKESTPLRKLLKTTGDSEFDEQVAKYGATTKPYNYDCYYNAETKRMEVNKEKIHEGAAVVLQDDTLAAYERVEAMANAINAIYGGVENGLELQCILRALEFGDNGKLVPTLKIYEYEDIVETCKAKACLS